jgi:hypothetical protein
LGPSGRARGFFTTPADVGLRTTPPPLTKGARNANRRHHRRGGLLGHAGYVSPDKLVHDPLVVEVIGGVVGVPLRCFPVLALLEVAGAAGLLAGIGLKPLGIAAGTGLDAYFVGAITSHLRKHDLVPGHIGPAMMMLAISTAALALRLAA